MTHSKTLVTGAAGFIAFHLIERLIRSGRNVVGLDNFDSFYSRELKEKNLRDLLALSKNLGMGTFDFVEGDVLEIENHALANNEFSSVIHLAAKAGVRPSLDFPVEYLHANVLGTVKVLEFCKNHQVDCIFASSSSVYGDSFDLPFVECSSITDRPISSYAASKRAAELYCSYYSSVYGVRTAALRFFTVYGPRQRPDLAINKFCRLTSDRRPITLYGDGTSLRDYTFVSDTVTGILQAQAWLHNQEKGTYEVFNLGFSSPIKLKELVTEIEKSLGVEAVINFEGRQTGDVGRTHADISKAGKTFGYKPEVSMANGIKQFVTWMQESSQL